MTTSSLRLAIADPPYLGCAALWYGGRGRAKQGTVGRAAGRGDLAAEFHPNAAEITPQPFVAELRGGGSTARRVTDPLATVTASGNHHGLVTPYYGASTTARSSDEPMGTLTTRDRYALIMRNNTGGAEMTTPAGEVMRTVTASGRQSVITPGDVDAAKARVDDCYFRMLEPTEAAAAMAFPRDYIWHGTRREVTRLSGNAVTPPAARDIIGAVAAALT